MRGASHPSSVLCMGQAIHAMLDALGKQSMQCLMHAMQCWMHGASHPCDGMLDACSAMWEAWGKPSMRCLVYDGDDDAMMKYPLHARQRSVSLFSK